MKRFAKNAVDAAMISLVIATGVGVGEFAGHRALQLLNRAELAADNARFDKFQRDLLKRYEQANPGSKPSTKDYQGGDI